MKFSYEIITSVLCPQTSCQTSVNDKKWRNNTSWSCIKNSTITCGNIFPYLWSMANWKVGFHKSNCMCSAKSSTEIQLKMEPSMAQQAKLVAHFHLKKKKKNTAKLRKKKKSFNSNKNLLQENLTHYIFLKMSLKNRWIQLHAKKRGNPEGSGKFIMHKLIFGSAVHGADMQKDCTD